MSEIRPTQEQDEALSMALSNKSFKINAFAGTGKTTTLKLIANKINKNGTYLAYNKSIASESKSSFPSSTKCLTFHSLAFRATPKHITDKLFNSRWLPSDTAKKFGLTSFTVPLKIEPKKTAELTGWDQAVILSKAIDNFCRTTDSEISLGHVLYAVPSWIDSSYALDIARYLLDKANYLWKMSIDDHTEIKISHDVYVKHWALTSPVVPGKYIFLDEAQDGDPLMLKILLNQDAQLILVGDSNQAIYGWRGAINAMQNTALPQTFLTQSFRFGPAIAECANLILNRLLGVQTPIKGNPNIHSQITGCEKPVAYLVRSNTKAFELAISLLQRKITPNVLVDFSTIETFINDVEKLESNVPLEKSSLLFGFRNLAEVLKYVEANEFSDIAPLSRLVSKNEIRLLRAVLKRCRQKGGDCTISTAHKSKGLEYDSVCLTDDYPWHPNYKIQNIPLMTPEEARLLYVAATRAINILDIGSCIELFDKIYELPQN